MTKIKQSLALNHTKVALKQILFYASENTLLLSQRPTNLHESFIDIHKSCKRATPNQMIVIISDLIGGKINDSL